MPVGIFDSGLGGLTVFEAIRARMPDQPLVYFGDNAIAPIGVRDAEDIYDITTRACERLFDEGCDLVILACNTASAVALKRMQENWVPKDKRVLGVFVPMIEALTERAWGDNSSPREVAVRQVALFATPATVASRAFQRELSFRAIGVDVEAQPCGGLVDALEDNDAELAEALARSHVAALKRRMPQPQAAVLGCTHYPILEHVFADALGPDVTVYSQGRLVAASLEDYLDRHPDMCGASGETRCLTSGNPVTVGTAATRFIGRRMDFSGV
ncbi:MAG: aspartate/glutamate racemase family protein [Pseudomonadota bacterium]